MKTVIIGDTHGRDTWKTITQMHPDIDVLVFLGDYFDSFTISAAQQINNFKEIIYLKETASFKVILLIGNHDHHYFSEVGNTGTSGYQYYAAHEITSLVSNNRRHLQIAYQLENILCTHAGVGKVFLDWAFDPNEWNIKNMAADLNALFIMHPKAFEFCGMDPTGDSIGQTPIWIRPKSLMIDAQEFKKEIIQVVGHTQMKKIPSVALTGGRYYFIDTLGTSGEYLVVENGEISIEIM
jgi:hypothetical protein